MPNEICNNQSYLNLLDQKKRFQLLNIPPVRYNNLANNPYLQIDPNTGQFFKKFDLDMRRKAEILKYNSNRMSTQTNSLTKSQRFAQAIAGNYKRRGFNQAFILNNTVNGVLVNSCPIIKTPSSACDVPGPPILLYDDPSIPLYNLVNDTNTNSFGIINQNLISNPIDFNNTRLVNVIANDQTNYQTITSVFIVNVDKPNYNFSLTTPVVLSISDQAIIPIYENYIDPLAFKVSIYSISLNVKYSFSNMSITKPPIYFDYFLDNHTIDISLNFPANTIPSYEAKCYLGELKIDNLILPVQKGYIYDIQILINYNILNTSTQYINFFNGLPTLTTYYDASFNYSPYKTQQYTITGAYPWPTILPTLHVSGNPL